MTPHDPRLHAHRPDLADETLRGQVVAATFVAGEAYRVSADLLSLRTGPTGKAEQGSELLFGESIRVFEVKDGWAWLQNDTDGYVGYAQASGLAAGTITPTHRISALRSYLYPEADLKAPASDVLTMNALLPVAGSENGFHRLSTGGWVWSGHTAAVGAYETDHGAVALRFLGTPYLWGGRSSIGLDCSGLVQAALAPCGIAAPRDSDMQADFLGETVPYDGDEDALRRGDLVFWPGHVGIWLDPGRFVHTNAAHMMTVVEPLADTVRRIRDGSGDKVTVVRRP